MISLDNKSFRTSENAHGLSSGETTFHYHQTGDLITGEYSGGQVAEGHIVGKQIGPRQIELLYHCLTTEGQLLAGDSRGTVSTNADGLLEIDFTWKWLNGDQSGGKSHYIEVENAK